LEHELVGHEVAGGEVGSDTLSECGAGGDFRPQQLT
jgi:hypothetical protein